MIVLLIISLQETGLYEYKIHGAMDDMDPELCAQVYVDWEYRKKWDSYVLGECLRMVGKGSLSGYIHAHFGNPDQSTSPNDVITLIMQ